MLTKERTVNILGTDIRVTFRKESEDAKLQNILGYFDGSKGLIVVKIPEPEQFSMGDLEKCQRECVRHEVIHAFLYESGLDSCSGCVDSWATNEEMVDWFALQAPKIFKVFSELEVL